MPDKAYLSNILKVWTWEAQRKLLAALGERLTFYQDEINPSDRKRKSVDALYWRGKLLAPTGRKTHDDVIYIPCWGNFAWDLRDLGRCFAAAHARGATLVALNTGLRIAPGAGAVEIAQAQKDFVDDKRRGAIQPGRLGREIATEQRLADTARRIDLIRQDWRDPAFALDELLLRAGRTTKRGALQPMAYSTARKALGVRSQIFKIKGWPSQGEDSKNGESAWLIPIRHLSSTSIADPRRMTSRARR